MQVISIDTNVLVRIFINDSSPNGKHQCTLARAFAKKTKQLYVTLTVVVETVWVLKRAYKLSKPEILEVLHMLLDNAAFTVEENDLYHDAVMLYEKHTIDFSDCLIHSKAKYQGHLPICTFDKQFSKLSQVKCL